MTVYDEDIIPEVDLRTLTQAILYATHTMPEDVAEEAAAAALKVIRTRRDEQAERMLSPKSSLREQIDETYPEEGEVEEATPLWVALLIAALGLGVIGILGVLGYMIVF